MKMSGFYHLIVWDHSSGEPVSILNEKKITLKKANKLRPEYEGKGYEVHCWELTEAAAAER